MAINITNLTDATSLYTYTQVADSATDGLLFGILLTAFFIVLVMNMRNQGVDKAVAAASFSCLIISLPLLYLELIQILFPISFAVVLAGTLAFLRLKSQ